MKKIVSSLMAILIIVSAITTTTALSVPESYKISSDSLGTISTEEKILTKVDINDNFVEDEIIVVLNNSTSKNLKSFSSTDFSEISVKSVENLTEDIDNMIKAQRDTEEMMMRGSVTVSTVDESNVFIDEDKHHQFFLLKLTKGGKTNVMKSIKLLEQRDDVILAMPNYIDVIEPMEESIATADEVIASAYAATNTLNDYTGKNGQWGIGRINLPSAWNITTGSSTVIVGVIDSGIRSDHEDLSANIAASSYHKNCIDGTSALLDPGGHGTQVAGVIAAKGDNGVGTAGVCWNIKLASLKVFLYNSSTEKYTTNATAFIEAITHATTKGIPILNYSAGGGSYDIDVLTKLVNYTGLIVVASGNENIEITGTNYYPASYNTDNMIVVAKGSDNANDALASDSNYSTTYVDLSAPGVNILTTDSDSENDYIVTEGSSLAAPFVTGVAALLKSKYPGMDAKALKYYIEKNVDSITILDEKVRTGGRLNADDALRNLESFTVSYDANGGGGGTMSDTTVIYGCSTPLRKNTYSRAGYEFKGWYIERADSNLWYYEKGSSRRWFEEGKQDPGYVKVVYKDGTKVLRTTTNGKTVIMHAKWEKKFNIEFIGNNSTSGSINSVTLSTGTTYYLPSTGFTRSNCALEHWYLKNSSEEHYCSNGTSYGWFAIGSKPSGYTRVDFVKGAPLTVDDIVGTDYNETIYMCAYWKPNYDILGDVNMDDNVTITDVTRLQKYLAGEITFSAYQVKIADVNFDGSATVQDASMIQKYLAGTIDEFGA